MIYEVYQAHVDLALPARLAAHWSGALLGMPWFSGSWTQASDALRRVSAACDLIAASGLTHARPPFAIPSVTVGKHEVPVIEEVIDTTPFCSLLHFAKPGVIGQPRVLVVAPMSGHFATLLRGTVRTLLRDNDVYVTDWRNGRDVPLEHGRFGFEEFVDHVIRFLDTLGPGAHVLAVCQPAVPVMAAVSLMAQANNPAQPRSMILMGGPIDTRVSPTKVNQLTKEQPIAWFEQNLVGMVPLRYPGACRRVYPGFIQLLAFMAMNIERHVKAHFDYYDNLVKGDAEAVATHRAFYAEYNAVMDLPAEFYLETVSAVFQQHLLPQGLLTWRGRRIEPAAIRRTALMVVEGELDDICAVGQTMAALDLCTSIYPQFKQYHLQTGVGHFGVFNGRKWNTEIYPKVRSMIQYTAA
jgi:polyhydroxyalkanoate depolymerase